MASLPSQFEARTSIGSLLAGSQERLPVVGPSGGTEPSTGRRGFRVGVLAKELGTPLGPSAVLPACRSGAPGGRARCVAGVTPERHWCRATGGRSVPRGRFGQAQCRWQLG